MPKRFNRASLLQGMVTPVGGTVRVPTGLDPVSQIEAQGFGTLASRLDQFASVANKMAIQTAESKGLAYGANNAPTIEDIELAKRIGAPVELPGDASSFSVFQRAAHKGGLSVAASRYEVAGRQAIAQEFAAASADTTLSPTDLRGKFDSVINEYTTAFSSVSPSESAAMQKSLSMVAASNLQTYTRTFASNQIKQNKARAISESSVITQDAVNIVDGYRTPIDPQPDTATLNDQLSAERQRIENHLTINNVPSATIATKLSNFDKAILEAKVSKFSNYARQPTSSALKLYKGLEKPNNLPSELREVWSSMGETDREAVYKRLKTVLTEQDAFESQSEAIETAENEAVTKQAWVNFNSALIEKDSEKVAEAIKVLGSLGIKTQGLMQYLDNPTPVTDPDHLQHLTNLVNANRLSPETLFDSKWKIKSEDLNKLMKGLRDQRSRLMGEAEDTLKREYQPDFITQSNQLSTAKMKQNQQYNIAMEFIKEKLDEHRDAVAQASEAKAAGKTVSFPKRFNPNNFIEEANKKVTENINKIQLPRDIKALQNKVRSNLSLFKFLLKEDLPAQIKDFKIPKPTDINENYIKDGQMRFFLEQLSIALKPDSSALKTTIPKLFDSLTGIEKMLEMSGVE